MRYILIYRYLIIAMLVVCSAGCERRFKETKFDLMNTVVEITAVGSKDRCQRAMERAFDEIRRIDGLMNAHDADSEISRVNQAAGKANIQVSADTLEVVQLSLRYAQLTDGALDVTIAPILELWGFGEGMENRIPTEDELKERLSLVNYRNIMVDESRSTVGLKLAGMKMDVSGIAKGYAVDRAIQVIRDAGVRSALVSAGGDLYAMGKPPGKKSWRIGIRHPRDNTNLLGILELKNKAVATSGDYENFFQVDDRRYCHIIDPATGLPVTDIISVTIVADSTAEADTLATAIFLLGTAEGMKLIESLEGVDGVIVTDSMRVMLSSGIKDSIQLSEAKPQEN